jgi:uncharacterized protein YhbP (UPF0306 family)
MQIHELTDAERELMFDELFRRLKIKRWQPSREDLEKEVIEYLGKKHPCTLATSSRNGVPRVSVVDYVNEGLFIYIFSEGGGKFKNLLENNRVAVGIGTSTRTIKSVRGVNIQGRADIFAEDAPEFSHAMKLFKPLFDDFEEKTGAPVVFPPGMVRVIRVTPVSMIYYHYMRGIAAATWEAAA